MTLTLVQCGGHLPGGSVIARDVKCVWTMGMTLKPMYDMFEYLRVKTIRFDFTN